MVIDREHPVEPDRSAKTPAKGGLTPPAFRSSQQADEACQGGGLGNQATLHLLQAQGVQTKSKIGQPGDVYEQEADRVAGLVAPSSGLQMPSSELALHPASFRVQRALEEGAGPGEATPETVPEPTTSGPTPETTPETASPTAETTTPGLLVDDEATELAPGQMRKNEFLAELRPEVCATANEALTGTGRTADPCPYLDYWFGYYAEKDSQHLERAMRRYAPETANAATAREYIPHIVARVRQGVTRWARTGEVTGVPEEIPVTAPGAGALSIIGGLFFKARDGGGQATDDPQAVRSQLRAGQGLDPSVRARMEAAFGYDFSNVRVHTDAKASSLSSGLNARAFTVGNDVAFGAGEYQPGTLIGDALIAHELAHVVQQGGATAVEPLQKGSTYNTLEDDADKSAVGAVVLLWGGAKQGLMNIASNVMPGLKSGLRLQRCATAGPQRTTTPATPTTCTPIAADRWAADVQAAQAIGDIDQRGAAMTRLAEQALCSLGILVRAAGNSHPNAVHPDDYQETPTLNFDVRLNQKTRWRGSGQVGPPVGENPGYNFSAGSRYYAIIGPRALDEDTLLVTQQYAQHELYMTSQAASRPVGESAADFELATWTRDFGNYFHRYLELPLPRRPQWAPLIGYYEQASAEARRTALDQLVAYYRNPPVTGAQLERFRQAFASWLRRRSGRLMDDLDAVLHLRTSTP